MSGTQNRRCRSEENDDEEEGEMFPVCGCRNKQLLIFLITMDILFNIYRYAFYESVSASAKPRLKISIGKMVLYPYWFACFIMDIVYVWYGVIQENISVIRAFKMSNLIFVIIMSPLVITQIILLSNSESVVPWYRRTTTYPVDMGDTFKEEYMQILGLCAGFLGAGLGWHLLGLYNICDRWENILKEMRSSHDDDDDDDDEEEEGEEGRGGGGGGGVSCREICQDFFEDKFWCKVKLFGLFLLLLNVLIIAYKFYYLVTTPADYRARVHIAEYILYPYWFACCLVCILFAQYGIFEEYQWALNMFEVNTFVEWSFLDILLLIELIAVSKHGNEKPWNQLTVGMTVARMFMVNLWSALMMHLCQSFERGLREKWEDRTPTIAQMCCPFRKS